LPTSLVPGVDHPDFADHLFYYHWANATFMTNGMMALIAQFMGAKDLPPFVADRVAKGWAIVSEDQATGTFNATATTFWFGFRDDVAVRVRAEGEGSVIDVRSTSRVGLSDLGANAARIRAFEAAFEAP
jgi:hypothetical protein